MTDRELLELAAKAAGINTEDQYAYSSILTEDDKIWNPLTDDGDALRLAVKLRMRVEVNETSITVQSLLNGKDLYEYPDDTQDKDFNVIYSGHDKAVRRAIVRAAAEIRKDQS